MQTASLSTLDDQMLNEWFSKFKLQLSWDQFQNLPRHPDYRYEFLQDQAVISGNPRYYHAILNLDECINPEVDASIRTLKSDEQSQLSDLFAESFANTAPIRHLSSELRIQAAEDLVQQTLQGKDGPLVENATLVALDSEGALVGAILITLIPSDDLQSFRESSWNIPPPANAIELSWGVPHLTWIFVSPARQRQGIASKLFAHAMPVLQSMGYGQLTSTFLLGNASSLLWHWKQGFELLSHPSSP